MSVAQLRVAQSTGAAMDTQIEPNLWTRQPLGVRIGVAAGGGIALLTGWIVF